jgi:hypothetical protein
MHTLQPNPIGPAVWVLYKVNIWAGDTPFIPHFGVGNTAPVVHFHGTPCGNVHRRLQGKKQGEPGEHSLRERLWIDADHVFFVQGRLEVASKAMQESRFLDLKVQFLVAAVVNRAVVVRVLEGKARFRRRQLVEVVHFHDVRGLEVLQLVQRIDFVPQFLRGDRSHERGVVGGNGNASLGWRKRVGVQG